MRRLIAIVLMLLLPIQSAWALVAMPCQGQVDMSQAHAAHAGHHGDAMQHALHAEAVATAALADPAGHDAHHGHHGLDGLDGFDGHHAAPQPAGHPDGDPCSGSAACMSLHSPPLAADFDAGLPVLQLPHALRPAGGSAFSSVPPAREQRPPIGLPA
ncbi:hypothetical protein [Azohydromonas aeria]|uniref:hypothetical protein n=1 Tax=Azohydromonas aeria TaxID=2590212 RepID=UPI0012FAFE89|nr:hypothetical protein [Azohydromonas aeria]